MSVNNFVESLTEEQKAALLEALTSKSNSSDSSEAQEKEKSNINEDFTMNAQVKTHNKREPVRARENIWKDTGEDRHITTPEKPLTPRARKPPKQKSVKCHICGKARKVNASLVYGEYYRCDSCSGNR